MPDAWNGVPENPERDGWHWLQDSGPEPEPRYWLQGAWLDEPGDRVRPGIHRYLGPCLTPAEVTAREAASAEAMREQAAHVCRINYIKTASIPVNECFNAIRALPLTTPALDALKREARREGMAKALEIAGENAWRHEGKDAYSRGMDTGARHQVEVIYAKINAAMEAE